MSTWGLGSEETLLQNSTLLFRQRTESLGSLALVDLVMALDNAVQVSMNYAKFCNQVGPFPQPRIHTNSDIVHKKKCCLAHILLQRYPFRFDSKELHWLGQRALWYIALDFDWLQKQ